MSEWMMAEKVDEERVNVEREADANKVVDPKSQVVKEIVDFILKDINEGKESNHLDYLDNRNIKSQELCNWLLEHQNDPDSIFLLGYFKFEINKKYNVDMPITNAVYNIIYANKDPRREMSLLSEKLS